MVDVTASLDNATQQVLALLAQLRLSNVRFLAVQDIGAADAYSFAPIPNVTAYGADLVLLADIATPNATTNPKLAIQGLPQVSIMAADGSPPVVGAISGKRLIGFSTLVGGGFVARMIGLSPADLAALLQPVATATVAAAFASTPFVMNNPGAFTYQCTATGVYEATLQAGGGGGGSGLSSGAGAGGGGGGLVDEIFYLTNGVTYSGSVGAGGQGAAAGTSNTGLPGSSTYFTAPVGAYAAGNTSVTATAGTGGAGANSGGSGLGGSGGGSSGGSPASFTTPGQGGYQGQNVGTPQGGQGGASGSGAPGGPPSNGNGNLGSAYGAGGGGSTANGYGGNGFAGRFILKRRA